MKTRLITLILLMVFFGTYAFAQCLPSGVPQAGQICTYNNSGTFVVPVGYEVVVSVQVWGGGGGGGDNSTGGTGRGSGGGGGGYSTGMHTITATTIDVNTSVTIGNGGLPESAAGHDGGISSFGTLTTASGGTGANGNTPGTGGTGNTQLGGAGGTRGNNSGGGGGGSGPGATAGEDGINNGAGGDGGEAGGIEDSGGDGGTSGVIGTNGTVPGGGGGGRGNSAANSGAGGKGRIIVTVVSVLPIELLSFSGKATPKNIQLNWQTGTELNNEKFVIERSTDGRTFQVIGEERGQGTTQQTQAYQFTDQAPVAGLNYYRLKQMDYDGQFAYSPVTAITFTRKGAISVYPTATNGMVNIVTEDEGSSLVKVFHINGSLMKQQTFDSRSLPLDISSLPNGTYLIVVETSTQTYQERIFKY